MRINAAEKQCAVVYRLAFFTAFHKADKRHRPVAHIAEKPDSAFVFGCHIRALFLYKHTRRRYSVEFKPVFHGRQLCARIDLQLISVPRNTARIHGFSAFKNRFFGKSRKVEESARNSGDYPDAVICRIRISVKRGDAALSRVAPEHKAQRFMRHDGPRRIACHNIGIRHIMLFYFVRNNAGGIIRKSAFHFCRNGFRLIPHDFWRDVQRQCRAGHFNAVAFRIIEGITFQKGKLLRRKAVRVRYRDSAGTVHERRIFTLGLFHDERSER